MNRSPNKEEKQFMKDVIWYGQTKGPVVKGDGRVQIHHVVGKSGKQNKVHIGYWFLLPLPWSHHDVHSDHGLNVTHFRKRFVEAYGTQRELFFMMVEDLKEMGREPPPLDVLAAIAATRY